MEVIDFIKKQLVFESLTNATLIDAIYSSTNIPERAIELMYHNLTVRLNWLEMKDNNKTSLPFWGIISKQAMLDLHAKANAAWDNYLSTLTNADMAKEFEYRIFDRPYRKVAIVDFIYHVLSHSHYHRAQISLLLKGHVNPLPNIGYLMFASSEVI